MQANGEQGIPAIFGISAGAEQSPASHLGCELLQTAGQGATPTEPIESADIAAAGVTAAAKVSNAPDSLSCPGRQGCGVVSDPWLGSRAYHVCGRGWCF
jgi:hypothetical protein